MTALTGSFEQIFDLLFGPQQHDAHCVDRRRHSFLKARTGNFDARMAAMMDEASRINADHRAKRAPAQFKIAAE